MPLARKKSVAFQPGASFSAKDGCRNAMRLCFTFYTVRVDLTTPGIGVLVTPHDRGREMAARTTTAFVREFGVQVAINGSYFDPFWVNTPLVSSTI